MTPPPPLSSPRRAARPRLYHADAGPRVVPNGDVSLCWPRCIRRICRGPGRRTPPCPLDVSPAPCANACSHAGAGHPRARRDRSGPRPPGRRPAVLARYRQWGVRSVRRVTADGTSTTTFPRTLTERRSRTDKARRRDRISGQAPRRRTRPLPVCYLRRSPQSNESRTRPSRPPSPGHAAENVPESPDRNASAPATPIRPPDEPLPRFRPGRPIGPRRPGPGPHHPGTPTPSSRPVRSRPNQRRPADADPFGPSSLHLPCGHRPAVSTRSPPTPFLSPPIPADAPTVSVRRRPDPAGRAPSPSSLLPRPTARPAAPPHCARPVFRRHQGKHGARASLVMGSSCRCPGVATVIRRSFSRPSDPERILLPRMRRRTWPVTI